MFVETVFDGNIAERNFAVGITNFHFGFPFVFCADKTETGVVYNNGIICMSFL